MNDIKFNIVRSFGVEANEEYNSSTFTFANELNIPHMVVLPFYNQTITDIVEQVGQIYNSLEQNNTLYIEFGNELYDGTSGMTAEQYIAKCSEAYTAVKSAYPNALVGVPYFPEMSDRAWNNTLLENQSCYDAIILHQYKGFTGSVNGYTQDDAMQYLYAYNNYNEKVIDKFTALAPGKEVWIRY